eukprot:gene6607-4728_t
MARGSPFYLPRPPKLLPALTCCSSKRFSAGTVRQGFALRRAGPGASLFRGTPARRAALLGKGVAVIAGDPTAQHPLWATPTIAHSCPSDEDLKSLRCSRDLALAAQKIPTRRNPVSSRCHPECGAPAHLQVRCEVCPTPPPALSQRRTLSMTDVVGAAVLFREALSAFYSKLTHNALAMLTTATRHDAVGMGLLWREARGLCDQFAPGLWSNGAPMSPAAQARTFLRFFLAQHVVPYSHAALAYRQTLNEAVSELRHRMARDASRSRVGGPSFESPPGSRFVRELQITDLREREEERHASETLELNLSQEQAVHPASQKIFSLCQGKFNWIRKIPTAGKAIECYGCIFRREDVLMELREKRSSKSLSSAEVEQVTLACFDEDELQITDLREREEERHASETLELNLSQEQAVHPASQKIFSLCQGKFNWIRKIPTAGKAIECYGCIFRREDVLMELREKRSSKSSSSAEVEQVTLACFDEDAIDIGYPPLQLTSHICEFFFLIVFVLFLEAINFVFLPCAAK